MKLKEVKDGMLLLAINVQDQIRQYIGDLHNKGELMELSDYGPNGEVNIYVSRYPGEFAADFDATVENLVRKIDDVIGVLPFEIKKLQYVKGANYKAQIVRLGE